MSTIDALPLGERASALLTSRYEQRLLQPSSRDAAARVVPAVIITGFLGSGKTTLVQHLLATAGQALRIAVLVNEVATVDIDSSAVNAKQRNAAVGVHAANLAGGCACCTVSGALEGALSALVASPAYQGLDYLLVETSGAGDASALAATLARSGFALDLVVCVIDAEAGADALRDHPVARAQLAAADVAVLNKVDLASMGTVCDLEDYTRQAAPGARLLRCRFGAVAPETLLDAESAAPTAATATTGRPRDSGGDSAAAGQSVGGGVGSDGGPVSVVGEVGFLSHEAPVAWGQQRGHHKPLQRAGRWRRSEQQLKDTGTTVLHQGSVPTVHSSDGRGATAHTHSTDHDHDHHSSSSSHSSFATETVVLDTAPLCMACFQCWLMQRLLPTPGLFRAKGTVWFAQRRRHRYTFHLSGRQRTECLQDVTPWEEPPSTRLVFIGQQREELATAAAALLRGCVSGACGCISYGASDGGIAAAAAALGVVAAGVDSRWAAAEEFRRRLREHPRFREVEGSSDPKPAGDVGDSGAPGSNSSSSNVGAARQNIGPYRDDCGLVEFSAEAAPLHGVVAEQVNAAVLRSANAAAAALAMTAADLGAATTAGGGANCAPPRFLCGIAASTMLSAATGLANSERPVLALQAAFRPQETAEVGAAAWAALVADRAAGAVLRRAYAHVTSCKCDVVAAMAAQNSSSS